MLETVDILLIILYFGLILFVGFFTGRKQEKEDYLIAARKLESTEATATIFSSRIGAAILLTYTALVYTHGMGALWYFIGAVFGLVIFYFFAAKVKKMADKHNFYTLPDYFFHTKGRFAGYLATIIVFIVMFGWVVLNFTAGAKLIEQYTPISYNLSVLIVGVVILLYLLAGGFHAVVKTDVIQSIGIFLLFILMVYLLFTPGVKIHLSSTQLFDFPVPKLISFFLAGFFIPMASPELWQRVYAIKDQYHLKKSLFLSSLFYLIIGFVLLIIGLSIKSQIPNLQPDTSLIVGFSKLLPAGLAGLSIVIVYSAVSSSADTYMFTAASSISQDFLERVGRLNHNNIHNVMRISLFVLMIAGILLALLLRDMVDATFLFVSLTMSLGFLTVILWMVPGLNRYSVNFSILACLLGVLIPAFIWGISTNLVIIALGFCISGLLAGFVYNYWRKLKVVKVK